MSFHLGRPLSSFEDTQTEVAGLFKLAQEGRHIADARSLRAKNLIAKANKIGAVSPPGGHIFIAPISSTSSVSGFERDADGVAIWAPYPLNERLVNHGLIVARRLRAVDMPVVDLPGQESREWEFATVTARIDEVDPLGKLTRPSDFRLHLGAFTISNVRVLSLCDLPRVVPLLDPLSQASNPAPQEQQPQAA